MNMTSEMNASGINIQITISPSPSSETVFIMLCVAILINIISTMITNALQYAVLKFGRLFIASAFLVGGVLFQALELLFKLTWYIYTNIFFHLVTWFTTPNPTPTHPAPNLKPAYEPQPRLTPWIRHPALLIARLINTFFWLIIFVPIITLNWLYDNFPRLEPAMEEQHVVVQGVAGMFFNCVRGVNAIFHVLFIKPYLMPERTARKLDILCAEEIVVVKEEVKKPELVRQQLVVVDKKKNKFRPRANSDVTIVPFKRGKLERTPLPVTQEEGPHLDRGREPSRGRRLRRISLCATDEISHLDLNEVPSGGRGRGPRRVSFCESDEISHFDLGEAIENRDEMWVDVEEKAKLKVAEWNDGAVEGY